MEFVEAPVFTKLLYDYLTDDGYRGLQLLLAETPEAGVLIPGTGGFRKLRWADSRRSKGKRGGLRVIYYYFAEHLQIWLLTIYNKDETADLSPEQRWMLKAAIDREKLERSRTTKGRR